MPQTGYPRLLDVLYGSPGCVFILSNGDRLQLEISGTTLSNYLNKCGFPGLDEICRARTAEVLYKPMVMSEREWDRISAVLRESKSSALDSHPDFRPQLNLSFVEVCALPLRMYGGVGHPPSHGTFYLSHPCDFVEDPDRKGKWFRGVFHAPHGHFLSAWVDLRSGQSEFVTGVNAGHYIEG